MQGTVNNDSQPPNAGGLNIKQFKTLHSATKLSPSSIPLPTSSLLATYLPIQSTHQNSRIMVDTKFRLTESPGQVQNSRELNNALMTEKVRAHFLKEALGKASGEIQDLVNENRKLSTKLEAKENENKKLSAELKALKKERKHDFGATSDLDLRMMMRLDELRYEEEALKNTFVASNEKFEDNIANVRLSTPYDMLIRTNTYLPFFTRTRERFLHKRRTSTSTRKLSSP